jgi:dCTP diphosphatase
MEDISSLQEALRDFVKERDWERYHTPRNLAALIASEAGELLALFRWDQDSVAESPERVREELADVLLGVLRFADITQIDVLKAAAEKIDKNRLKYPSDKVLGPDPPK